MAAAHLHLELDRKPKGEQEGGTALMRRCRPTPTLSHAHERLSLPHTHRRPAAHALTARAAAVAVEV